MHSIMLAGLVTAAGGVIEPAEADSLAAELGRQQKALKDVTASIADESKHLLRNLRTGPDGGGADEFGGIHRAGFGAPEEGDLRLIRFLREEFKKKDPTWGGLEPRDDGKFSRVWAHPRSR